MKDVDLTIGCDPEFFLKKGKRFVSAHDMVPGTKDKPFLLYKGAVQADGVAVEFNIDPAETFEEFNDNIDTVLEQIREIIPSEYEFCFEPDATFDETYFNEIPEYAKAVGCFPDMDYYGYRRIPEALPNIRFGGGHMHVGWDRKKVSRTSLGLAQNFHTNWMETQKKDRSTRARNNSFGYHRDKPYGVELRDPSNLWFKDSKSRQVLFDCVVKSATEYLTNRSTYRW